ncbi:uncharacterized protein LOC134530328 [Bacillus rossius redtenbacheri]|uniref:uncharacterized protein LOC134530328 n=1 Tax=Bacillus rossius redtenbacheri TaxID=93214 RepID=UPI002FDDE3C7
MPRKYKPIVGGGYKKHSPDHIKNALSDIESGISLRKAAEKHGIHYSVLYRHVKRGPDIKHQGGQTALSFEEENLFVDRLKICSEWGYPIDSTTLRLLVKDFLDSRGKEVKRFKNNLPGRDFVVSFIRRHKDQLAVRMCQNIKRSRAGVTPETINSYFDELSNEIENVPPSNIINYDETNLTDDPGKRKIITRRGTKYPERIMNSSKASTSVMFAAAADGTILPPYVVYKALHLYQTWTEGGPKHARYNRTKSGWFDSFCFEDWVLTVAIPYLKKLDGKKFLIGDNLSSHLSLESVKLCQDNDIRFIFLPANSTHLTQPLDVAFFRPLKTTWRQILEEWKKGPGRNEATVPKDKFPLLLKKLCVSLKEKNVIAGFRKCGIVPLNRNNVLSMLPGTGIDQNQAMINLEESTNAVDKIFKELLQSLRQDQTPKPKKKRTKVKVQPGRSVTVDDFEEVDGENVTLHTSLHSDPSPCTSKQAKPMKRNAKKNRKFLDSSSEDDCAYSVQDSDDDLILISSNSSDQDENTGISISQGDYMVVKIYGKTKTSFRYYVCKVSYLMDNGFVGTFLKRVPQTKKFTMTEEESFVSKNDVFRKLSSPVLNSGARFKDMLCFEDDLTDLTVY